MGFDPISLTVGSAVLGAAGSGMSAMGAMTSAESQKEDALYQAQVARNDAIIAQQNAEWETQAGEEQAFEKGLQTRGVVGTEKAHQGASNIDVNSGSAAAVRSATQQLGEFDVKTIESTAAKRAYGYKVQATSDTAQAQLDTMKAKQASEAGDINALGSFISGGANLAKAGAGFYNQASNTGGAGGNSIFDPNAGVLGFG